MEGMSDTGRSLSTQSLISDLRQIVEQCRNRVALNVNAELTMMYWHIWERINRDVLGYQRAEYGKQIVASVSRQLQTEYGPKGFDSKNIHRMMQFAQKFPEEQIELLQLDKSGIKVAKYLTELPSREILRLQIQKSLAAARERLDYYTEEDE